MISAIPADLPVLITSGEADPLGGMGERVRLLHAAYQTAGLRDVTLRLYPDCRHELLNELNRQEIFADLHAWLTAHLSGQ